MRVTELNALMDNLDGGGVKMTLEVLLSELAHATMLTGKESEITLKLKMKPIGTNGNMINMTHDMKYSRPTEKGKVTENRESETPFYVAKDGQLSMTPEKEDLFAGENVTKLKKEA